MKPRYAIATVLYCAWIFYMSSQSFGPEPRWDFPGRDKLAHIVLYGGLTAIVSFGIRRRGRPVPPRVQFLAPVLFALFYGCTDEFHQSFTPGRNVDPWDVVANVCGALLVQSILCFGLWRIRLREKPAITLSP